MVRQEATKTMTNIPPTRQEPRKLATCKGRLQHGEGMKKPKSNQMSDEELANKLLCVLTKEMIHKSELFDYLCWLEEKEQSERVPGAAFLVLASDGRTCWGKSYAEAVAAAMKYDAKPYGEHRNRRIGA